MKLALFYVLVLSAVACNRNHSHGQAGGHAHGDDHGHDHGDAHGHGADGKHAEEEEAEPLAITRWTERSELFVEFPPPAPSKPVSYHAHVTRLSDFQAVTEGRFTVRYKQDGKVAAEASIDKVLRAGIFKPEGPAPAAGRYAVEMTYEHGGQTDVFDCGLIEVTDKPKPESEEADAGEISFLKETQWKIPFATAWATSRDLRRAVDLPTIVETAGSDQMTLGAPTSGRFFHDEKEALAAGRRVKKGEVLGSIVPNVEGEDFTRLEASADEASLAKKQTEAEIARISPLVEQGLLPERRLIELRNELSVQDARVAAARRRVGRVIAPGGAGGLPIRATMDGLLREVLVPNGEPVQAGAVLVRMAGTDHLWLRARFVARPTGELTNAEPVGVRLADGKRVDLLGRASFLSGEPIVDPATRLATWLVDVVPGAAGADAELRPGASVVLSVRAGAPRKVLAVPRTAIVEISTRPFVFVQAGGESFVKRRVELGMTDGVFTEITAGVADGERVVTAGGFDVHIASLSGTVESHRH
jgi:cobalt-zinc-cadmium efflux system membrane fusion protein